MNRKYYMHCTLTLSTHLPSENYALTGLKKHRRLFARFVFKVVCCTTSSVPDHNRLSIEYLDQIVVVT